MYVRLSFGIDLLRTDSKWLMRTDCVAGSSSLVSEGASSSSLLSERSCVSFHSSICDRS